MPTKKDKSGTDGDGRGSDGDGERNRPGKEESVEELAKELLKRTTELTRQTEVLQRLFLLGRGTSDLDVEAAKAVVAAAPEPPSPPPPPPPPLVARVEQALREHALNLRDLAKLLGAPVGPTSEVLQAMHRAGRTYNVGTEYDPTWILKPGPNATHAENMHAIRRTLKKRPMGVRSLAEDLGVTPKNVDSAIVDLRRTENMWNMDMTGRAVIWFIMSENARPARLAHKRSKKPKK